MELLLISDSKLKVMLSPKDMEQYEITCENIDYDNTETRRAFWSILNQAKHQTGFDAAADRIFIQVYPSRGGGCEIFVTKIDIGAKADNKDDSARLSASTKAEKSTVKSTSPKPRRRLAKSIFHFDTMDDMLSACYHLEKTCEFVSSSAYSHKSSSCCYLALEWEQEDTPAYLNMESKFKFAVAIEYGRHLSEKEILPYINEHCDYILAYDAVQSLAMLHQ